VLVLQHDKHDYQEKKQYIITRKTFCTFKKIFVPTFLNVNDEIHITMSKQKAAQTDKARKILGSHGDDMKKKYAIEGSAVGYKVKDGKYTDTVALIFYVKEKKSKEELLSHGITPIPKEIDGVPTDVVVISKGFQPR
jgi:hypothetical protein